MENATKTAAPGVSRAAAEGGRLPQVLVIDDEPLLGHTLRLGLRDSMNVSVETSGEKGLERVLGSEAFELVLCDLSLPDKMGADIFEAISAPEAGDGGALRPHDGRGRWRAGESFRRLVFWSCLEQAVRPQRGRALGVRLARRTRRSVGAQPPSLTGRPAVGRSFGSRARFKAAFSSVMAEAAKS